MLITNEYKKLNEQLHSDNAQYGRSGSRNTQAVLELSLKYNTKDVLDYGCGKSTLAENLPFNIQQYDPAIEKHSKLPNLADIVVCTDVMEHIEPECLESVLEHIKSVTKKVAYFVISTRPAQKTLADGRNAHICLHPAEWWVDKMNEYFKVVYAATIGDDVAITCEVKEVFNGVKVC
jgi:hypothetical protein